MVPDRRTGRWRQWRATPSFFSMAPLALALHLALASPGLAPPLDPGPFQGSGLVGSSLGVMAGDMLVLAGGYFTLQLFASDTINPSAANFRRAAYALGVTALVVPPLTAVLLARWLRAEPASGTAWKALLLAAAGQATALAVGFVASLTSGSSCPCRSSPSAWGRRWGSTGGRGRGRDRLPRRRSAAIRRTRPPRRRRRSPRCSAPTPPSRCHAAAGRARFAISECVSARRADRSSPPGASRPPLPRSRPPRCRRG